MATVGEEIERHREEQELASEEALRQAELERQREEERRRRQRMAQQAARQGIRKQVTKRVKRRVVAAIAETLSALFATIGPYVLATLAIVVVIIGMLFLVAVTLTAYCNAGGWTGRLAQTGSSLSGFLGGPDFCKSLAGFQGIATIIDKTQLPPPGGALCPRNIQPPAGYVIDCSNCVDLRTYGIPVKSVNTNPYADARAAERLVRLLAINQDFWVTEAFCPWVNHEDPKHYTGMAIDVNLQLEFAADKLKLAKLYNDAKSVGFVDVLCEYQSGYLTAYGVSCQIQERTTGGHIHVEEP